MSLDLDDAQEFRNSCRKLMDQMYILKEEIAKGEFPEAVQTEMFLTFWRSLVASCYVPDFTAIMKAMSASEDEDEE